MTTIAFKNGIVAADSGLTRGSLRVSEATKIVQHTTTGDIAGGCGDWSWINQFLEWFLRGESEGELAQMKTDKDGDGDSYGIIFRTDGSKIILIENRWSFPVVAPYYALGSGSAVALGAMFAGASAEEAIRAAMQHDEGTWGSIRSLTLGKVSLREAA